MEANAVDNGRTERHMAKKSRLKSLKIVNKIMGFGVSPEG